MPRPSGAPTRTVLVIASVAPAMLDPTFRNSLSSRSAAATNASPAPVSVQPDVCRSSSLEFKLRSKAVSWRATWHGSTSGVSTPSESGQRAPEGVRFYTKLKAITTRWPSGIRAGAEFVMLTMS